MNEEAYEVENQLGEIGSTIAKPYLDVEDLLPSTIKGVIISKTLDSHHVDLIVKYGNGRQTQIRLNRHIPSLLFAYCVGLYAGEGTKRPRQPGSHYFEFVNSDLSKVRVMVEFLGMLGIPRHAIRPRLQVRLRVGPNVKRTQHIQSAWAAWLELEPNQFRRASVRQGPNPSRSRPGTLSIRVYNAFLMDLFAYWIEAIMSTFLMSSSPKGQGFPGNASSAGSKPVLRPTLTG